MAIVIKCIYSVWLDAYSFFTLLLSSISQHCSRASQCNKITIPMLYLKSDNLCFKSAAVVFKKFT